MAFDSIVCSGNQLTHWLIRMQFDDLLDAATATATAAAAA